MATLNGSDAPVALGPDVLLVAPGLVGRAELRAGTLLGGRADEPGRATTALQEALRRSGMAEAVTVEIQAQEVPTGPSAVRSSDGRAGLVLEVPALGPQRGQVLLLADEQGILSWHFPEPVADAGAGRGPGGAVRFVVPREVATVPPPAVDATDRSLVTAVGKKLLSVLVYPILEPLIGRVARDIAAAYEDRRRPYRVRTFRVGQQREAAAGTLDGDGWRRLADGPALLFLHGTFSTSHGGFAGLPNEVLGSLSAAYGGRVFAFDHPSLSVDPIANAVAFLQRIPPEVDLELDAVCHSRGGLVARALVREARGASPRLAVRRIVFVGTPNAGTELADPKHMGAFVDRYTSLLNLLPPGPWSAAVDVFESVLEVVKVIGQGALGGLPGLAAMAPAGSFLAGLNAGADAATEHYAIDANFEPSGSLLRLVRAPDAIVDRIFDSAANDMIVPSDGVGMVAGPGFPVPPERLLRLGADQQVWHCSYLAKAATTERLTAWLTG